MTIRVVIVEDSPTMRAILTNRLSRESDIEVVAAAANAAEGRQMIRELDPDVVTLDIEMPGMNGLDFLAKIMALRPTPVIIVSGTTHKGADTTARALALGAVDCFDKGELSAGPRGDDGALVTMIRNASRVRFAPRAAGLGGGVGGAGQPPLSPPVSPVIRSATATLQDRPRLIAIGSSTGGVEALQTLLARFPENCPPTLIVQHISARFAPAVARTLDAASPVKIQLAEPDMPLRDGHVYLAPGDARHLMVSAPTTGSGPFHSRLRAGDPVAGHCPSVDVLFASVAEAAGAGGVGILLTGMGADGARGLLAMAQAGARTIAQDEATCTVFGMPRAAISLGAARVVAPLDAIARHAFSKAA